MKKLALFACCLSLAGCTADGQPRPTLPSFQEQTLIATEVALAPKADRPEILVAVTMEVGARFSCPDTLLEQQLLFTARLSFDLLVRGRIQSESGTIVDRLRDATNAACGFVPLPPEPVPDPPPAPTPGVSIR